MDRFLVLAAAVALCLFGTALASPSSQDRPERMSERAHELSRGNPHAMVDLIVTYNGRPGAAARARVENAGGTVQRSFDSIPGHAVRVPAHAAAALARNPNVEWVTIDAPVRSASVSADTDTTQGPTDGALPASQLYPGLATTSYTGAGQSVAVLDSGYKNHADLRTALSGNVRPDGSALSGETLDDDFGHGNHVMGIIAGQGSNKDGDYRGVAPGVQLVSIRVLNDDGEGLTSDVIAGIDKALELRQEYGIRVINLSLGHPIYEPAAVDPLVLAVESAVAAGLVVVCSAGNDGADGYGTITSPGNAPNAITVGSVSYFEDGDPFNDKVSSYSSRGPSLGDHYVKPDLLAPGNKVISTQASGSYLPATYPERLVLAPGDRKEDYFVMSGTSMAAAMVSGAAALMLEQEPALTPADVKARLMRSARKADMGTPFDTGAGVLDVAAALQESGYAVAAPSPKAYRDELTGLMGFDNTAVGWGGAEWSQSIIWGESIVWGESVVWSDSIVWSDSVVWGGSLIWSDSIVWGESVVWSDSIVWGTGLTSPDKAHAQSAIWGE